MESTTKKLKKRVYNAEGKESSNIQEVILEIGHRCTTLPDQDPYSPEEILGYDKFGLPP